MQTARQLTEAQAKLNHETAQFHRDVANDSESIAQIELENARLALKQKALEQQKADQAYRAGVAQSNIARNEKEVIQANMDLNEINIAYNAFGAITNVFANIVVSSSIVAGFVFVPLSGMDLSKVDDHFTSVILLFSVLALTLLLHTVYVATESTIQGTKQVYEISNSAAVVWSGVEAMTVLQTKVHWYPTSSPTLGPGPGPTSLP